MTSFQFINEDPLRTTEGDSYWFEFFLHNLQDDEYYSFTSSSNQDVKISWNCREHTHRAKLKIEIKWWNKKFIWEIANFRNVEYPKWYSQGLFGREFPAGRPGNWRIECPFNLWNGGKIVLNWRSTRSFFTTYLEFIGLLRILESL
jgi:hypothetical protein